MDGSACGEVMGGLKGRAVSPDRVEGAVRALERSSREAIRGAFFEDRGEVMRIRSSLWNRVSTGAGLLALAMTLMLMPAGVRIVRAEDADGSLMSVDPALVANATKGESDPDVVEKSSPAAPILPLAKDPDAVERPGIAGREIQPGIVVLNTRGYNYGPPPAPLDPAAIGVESKTD